MDVSSLEDVAFLTRSEHRVEVLDRLMDEEWSRRELHDATGISQPTLGRILSGFEDRGWAVENGAESGRKYALTPLGELLSDEFSTLLDTAGAIRNLRDVASDLPFEEMDFDPALLREARITTAGPDDVLAHMRRQIALSEQADHVRTLCSSFSPSAIEAQREQILHEGQTGEAIVWGDALDRLSEDDELAGALGELIESDRLSFYRYDGPVPVMLDLFDDTAGIVPLDDEGMPCEVFIETDDEEVVTWAADTLDTYRDRAEEVTAGDVPG